MRSFQQVIVFLFALVAFVHAQYDTSSYDATVYVTSTVYRVNTITVSGYATGVAANSTSTIYPTSSGTAASISSYPSGVANGTTGVYPSGTIAPSASAPAFTGAASRMNVPAALAALAAGVGYLAL